MKTIKNICKSILLKIIEPVAKYYESEYFATQSKLEDKDLHLSNVKAESQRR
jgi:hypothetical protein